MWLLINGHVKNVYIIATVDEGGVNWVRIGTIVRQDDTDDSIFDANFSLSAVWPRKFAEWHLLT